MKIKLFVTVFTAVVLLCPSGLRAQTNDNPSVSSTNLMKTGLQALVQKILVKVKAGDRKESDFTAELKGFDDLVAQANGAKTEDVAQVLLAKSQLYSNILKDNDNAKIVLNDLKTNYPDTKAGKNVDRLLATLDHKAASEKIQATLVAGSTFPDFAKTNLDGQPIAVADYKGKVVLVDFWATWCGPCKAELPNVVAAYKKHHADGFEVVGVSLDFDRKKLEDYLKNNEEMSWPEIYDDQNHPDTLAHKYGIDMIPFNVLIGPDGKIADRNLRGEKLETAVAAALAKK